MKIHRNRMTARMDGEFVVFLIGMRINQPLRIDKWLPMARTMPRMLKELYADKSLGLLGGEMWFSRTILLVQYWRSMEALLAYAKLRDAAHLPAWQAFNRRVGTDGTLGIWHETYVVAPGRYENVYVNMPKFGLGRAGVLVEATGGLQSASGRMGQPPKSTPVPDGQDGPQ